MGKKLKPSNKKIANGVRKSSGVKQPVVKGLGKIAPKNL